MVHPWCVLYFQVGARAPRSLYAPLEEEDHLDTLFEVKTNSIAYLPDSQARQIPPPRTDRVSSTRGFAWPISRPVESVIGSRILCIAIRWPPFFLSADNHRHNKGACGVSIWSKIAVHQTRGSHLSKTKGPFPVRTTSKKSALKAWEDAGV